MAEAWLETIYHDAKIVSELKQIVVWIREYDGLNAIKAWNGLIQELTDICQKWGQHDVEAANELWDRLRELVGVSSDILLLGDGIECDIIPRMDSYMQLYGEIQVEEGTIGIESTKSGFLTLRDLENNVYFHSTVDPMSEARLLAEYIYDPQKEEYAIFGCGLGYLVYQLYDISRGSIKISVFEPEHQIVEYACKFGVLDWIPKDVVQIVESDDVVSFLTCVEKKEVGFHICDQAVGRLPVNYRTIMEKLCIEYNSMRRNTKENSINFWKNIRSDAKLISEIDIHNIGREFIVVAAGPSLDDLMDFLKEQQGKKTIVAVGTIFKKLIKNNIKPDFVVILDPFKETYKQIEGVEEQDVPMLLSMTTYWRIADRYQGEKYLIPIMGNKEASEFAESNGEEKWSCGGTVTSLAIECCIKMGAERIYLVGVDLAYPDGYSHAKDALRREKISVENMIKVPGVSGTSVFADKLFRLYREQIEERISQTPQIKYYNMSRVGARISGTIEL